LFFCPHILVAFAILARGELLRSQPQPRSTWSNQQKKVRQGAGGWHQLGDIIKRRGDCTTWKNVKYLGEPAEECRGYAGVAAMICAIIRHHLQGLLGCKEKMI